MSPIALHRVKDIFSEDGSGRVGFWREGSDPYDGFFSQSDRFRRWNFRAVYHCCGVFELNALAARYSASCTFSNFALTSLHIAPKIDLEQQSPCPYLAN